MTLALIVYGGVFVLFLAFVVMVALACQVEK